MSDNEIIKALECCTGANAKMCEACHLKKHPDCEYRLQDGALALLKRQQAEIKRLTAACNVYADTIKDCEVAFSEISRILEETEAKNAQE